VIASSLDKFATELRALQKTEVHEVEEPFSAGQTGSSAMPHKRNPELGERVSGLARLIRGHSVTALENQALWHERDISHSSNERLILPDSCLALDYILGLFTSILSGLQVFPKRMKKNLELTKGLVFSQRVMLTLIDKGLSRQKAYELVQKNAMKAWKSSRSFITLLKHDSEVMTVIKAAELEAVFDYQYYLGHVNEIFNRLGLTEAQWRDKYSKTPINLMPRTIQSN
jgi:adenylosuccinate lyase